MILLSDEVLNPQQAIDAVLQSSDGAHVLFTGVVRDHARGRAVTGLELSAHATLARAQMKRIVEEVRARFGLECAILHRLGWVPVGEATVVICVASSHRAEAFEACRFAIDALKFEVPIWKLEHTAGGAFWIEGDESFASDAPSVREAGPVREVGPVTEADTS